MSAAAGVNSSTAAFDVKRDRIAPGTFARCQREICRPAKRQPFGGAGNDRRARVRHANKRCREDGWRWGTRCASASLAARTVAIETTSDARAIVRRSALVILRLLLTESCRRLRYRPKHTMWEPTARAMNCCPPDAKVIGEVLMVAFSGTRHNVFPSRSSTATK